MLVDNFFYCDDDWGSLRVLKFLMYSSVIIASFTLHSSVRDFTINFFTMYGFMGCTKYGNYKKV